MIATIHQIEHAPHLSLFNKFEKADVVILGDTFDFKKNYYENRNKILYKDSWKWITVPVEQHNHKPIKDVKIIYDGKWEIKYLGSLTETYGHYPYFNTIYPVIEHIIMKKYEYISDLNLDLMIHFMDMLGIRKHIFLSSKLNVSPDLTGTDLLVELCKKVDADTYLSGPSGKDYLDLSKFENIKVEFHELNPGLSVYDYLFTKGTY